MAARRPRPDADKPWFAYFSTGCSHAPHHVPPRVVGQVQGQVRPGLGRAARGDVRAPEGSSASIPADAELTPRDDAFPAWDSLDETQQASLRAPDGGLRRATRRTPTGTSAGSIDAIEEMGELDNTLVIYIWGDNGASMEGTLTGTFNELTMLNGIPLTDEQQLAARSSSTAASRRGAASMMAPHYSAAWAWAGNTPVPVGQAGRLAPRRHAQPDGRALARADRATRAGCARQFTHVHRHRPDDPRSRRASRSPTHVDGIEQQPMHGTSFAYSLRRRRRRPSGTPSSTSRSSATAAMYKDGWWLAMRCCRASRGTLDPGDAEDSSRPASGTPTTTRSSCTTCPTTSPRRSDLAGRAPGEGRRSSRSSSGRRPRRYQVLPLLGGLDVLLRHRCRRSPSETTFTYHGDVQNVAAGMIPRIYNHSYTISADLDDPATAAPRA